MQVIRMDYLRILFFISQIVAAQCFEFDVVHSIDTETWMWIGASLVAVLIIGICCCFCATIKKCLTSAFDCCLNTCAFWCRGCQGDGRNNKTQTVIVTKVGEHGDNAV